MKHVVRADGAPAMSGKNSGFVSHVKKKRPGRSATLPHTCDKNFAREFEKYFACCGENSKLSEVGRSNISS